MTLFFVVTEVNNYSLNIVPPETLFCERISFEDIPGRIGGANGGEEVED